MHPINKNINPSIIKVQIPLELARYAVSQRALISKYETNQFLKCIDTWLILKAETESSLIQNWNLQKKHLFELCKISEVVFRSRLSWLAKKNFLCLAGGNIKLISWSSLSKILNLDLTKKLTVEHGKTSKQTISQWIIASEIEDNQSRQAYKVNSKLNKNPELNMMLTGAVLKAGADRNRISDPAYFRQWLCILYREDFVRVSDIHSELIEVRPDTNRGVKAIAKAWSFKSPQSVSYWKKKMIDSGIIDVSKLQIESDDRARNKYCKVLWDRKKMQTILCLCDQITVLKPWEFANDVKLFAA